MKTKKLLTISRKSKQEDKQEKNKKSEYRQEILKKIEQLEKEGKFDVDVEDDPPTIVLTPENIDYLRKKMTSTFRCCKERVAVAGKIEEKRLYKVIREGNYTNFPGLYGFFFRNCDTLPLSSNKRTMVEFMKAVDTLLQKGDFILIYPEQSMWWNYRKPKPLKHGAFKMAVRNNVPVIPIFITMEDSDKIDGEGYPIQEYTVNIAEPIYPDENLSTRENMEIMLNKNFEVWKQIYEDFYGIPLEYTTEIEKENVNV